MAIIPYQMFVHMNLQKTTNINKVSCQSPVTGIQQPPLFFPAKKQQKEGVIPIQHRWVGPPPTSS